MMDLDEDFDNMLQSYVQEIMEEPDKEPVQAVPEPSAKKAQKPSLEIKSLSALTSLDPAEVLSPKMVRIYNALPEDNIIDNPPQLVLTCYCCNLVMASEEALADHLVEKVNQRQAGRVANPQIMANLEICHLCCMVFSGMFEVAAHYQSYHKDKPVICEGCDLEFDEFAQLVKHLKACPKFKYSSASEPKSETKNEVMRCFQCKFECTNGADLSAHWAAKHGIQSSEVPTKIVEEVESLSCGLCKLNFASKMSQRSHWTRYHKVDAKNPQLNMVMKILEGEDRTQKLPCGLCPSFKFKDKERILHWKECHAVFVDSCPFYCHLCSLAFMTSYDLESHECEYIHDDNPAIAQKCPVCEASVGSELLGHLMEEHSLSETEARQSEAGVIAYACDLCGVGQSANSIESHFNLSHGLTLHDMIKVKQGQWEIAKINEPASWRESVLTASILMLASEADPLDYQCHVCRQSFAHRYQVKEHVTQTHTLSPNELFDLEVNQFKGTRKFFQCPICSHQTDERRHRLKHMVSVHGLNLSELWQRKKVDMDPKARAKLVIDNLVRITVPVAGAEPSIHYKLKGSSMVIKKHAIQA